MSKSHYTVLTRLSAKAVLLAAVAMLSACTGGVSSHSSYSVADAYRSSDAVVVNPYTRTIFSSGNF